MAPMGWQMHPITHTQIKGLGWIIQPQAGAAPQERHPFMLSLVVPKPVRALGRTGVNQLQTPRLPGMKDADVFRARWRQAAAQQRIHHRCPWGKCLALRLTF